VLPDLVHLERGRDKDLILDGLHRLFGEVIDAVRSVLAPPVLLLIEVDPHPPCLDVVQEVAEVVRQPVGVAHVGQLIAHDARRAPLLTLGLLLFSLLLLLRPDAFLDERALLFQLGPLAFLFGLRALLFSVLLGLFLAM
jgi:hypothetical protein